MPSSDTPTLTDIDQLAIDTIRTLSMDAVEAAKSGHPGTPMALAPVAYTVWKDFLRYDPDDPSWPNRDRFVLSCGHASMLLYSLIHLAGIKQGLPNPETNRLPAITLDDIKKFQDIHRKDQPINFRLCKGIYVESEKIAYKKYEVINNHFLEIVFPNTFF